MIENRIRHKVNTKHKKNVMLFSENTPTLLLLVITKDPLELKQVTKKN